MASLDIKLVSCRKGKDRIQLKLLWIWELLSSFSDHPFQRLGAISSIIFKVYVHRIKSV